MKPNPLAGRKGYWCREFKDTGDQVVDEILATLTGLGGGNLLVLKVPVPDSMRMVPQRRRDLHLRPALPEQPPRWPRPAAKKTKQVAAARRDALNR